MASIGNSLDACRLQGFPELGNKCPVCEHSKFKRGLVKPGEGLAITIRLHCEAKRLGNGLNGAQAGARDLGKGDAKLLVEETHDVEVALDGGNFQCAGQECNVLQEVSRLQWYWVKPHEEAEA